jgi:hypothetical protein
MLSLSLKWPLLFLWKTYFSESFFLLIWRKGGKRALRLWPYWTDEIRHKIKYVWGPQNGALKPLPPSFFHFSWEGWSQIIELFFTRGDYIQRVVKSRRGNKLYPTGHRTRNWGGGWIWAVASKRYLNLSIIVSINGLVDKYGGVEFTFLTKSLMWELRG